MVKKNKRYSIIYADPPWKYADQGCQGTMANHYKGMELEDIKALPVQKITDKNCVLFLWATYPMLREALEVIEAWGFCVGVNTKILTSDLRWVKAKDLKKGDNLLSFDDELRRLKSNSSHRYFAWSKVISTGIDELPCYRITMADGTEIISSDKHKWFVRTSNGIKNPKLKWVQTRDLPRYLKNSRRKGLLYLHKFAPREHFDNSYNSGFLSGAFDGEGSIHTPSLYLTFTQRDNVMLSKIEAILKKEGYKFRKNTFLNRSGNLSACLTLHHFNLLKFLMRCRPPRLLKKFTLSQINKTSIYIRQKEAIKSVEFIGLQEVATLQTSNGTYIAEGFGAHNTYKSIAFQWLKLNPKSKTPFYGLGRWTRGNTEPCLLATKGKPKRISASVFQLIQAPRGRHSQKPPEVRKRIVQLMGDLHRIELFARKPQGQLFDDPTFKGWNVLGDDIDGKDIQQSIKELIEAKK